jgi:hypothetical protein
MGRFSRVSWHASAWTHAAHPRCGEATTTGAGLPLLACHRAGAASPPGAHGAVRMHHRGGCAAITYFLAIIYLRTSNGSRCS